MGKGSDYERKLARKFTESSRWSVVRSGGSGGGTDGERPDLLAGCGSKCYAVEAKYTSYPPIYLEQREVDALKSFADNLQANAVIGARFNAVETEAEADHYLVPTGYLRETQGGSDTKRLSVQRAIDHGTRADSVL